MERENLEELKKELLDIRYESLTYISKKIFTIFLTATLLAASCKLVPGSFPFIIDKEKKYRVESISKSNIKDINKKITYESNKELQNVEASILLTIKSKYILNEEGKYIRNVQVYKITEKEINNIETILTNYNDYSIKKNLIEEYIEYDSNIDTNFFNNFEIIINYNKIDKTDYKLIKESKDLNKITTIIYIFMTLVLNSDNIHDVINEKVYYNSEKKRIKKLIKKKSPK